MLLQPRCVCRTGQTPREGSGQHAVPSEEHLRGTFNTVASCRIRHDWRQFTGYKAGLGQGNPDTWTAQGNGARTSVSWTQRKACHLSWPIISPVAHPFRFPAWLQRSCRPRSAPRPYSVVPEDPKPVRNTGHGLPATGRLSAHPRQPEQSAQGLAEQDLGLPDRPRGLPGTGYT